PAARGDAILAGSTESGIRKGGRVVECAGLEIRYTVLPYRGFESLPFRQPYCLKPSRDGFFAALRQWARPSAGRRPGPMRPGAPVASSAAKSLAEHPAQRIAEVLQQLVGVLPCALRRGGSLPIPRLRRAAPRPAAQHAAQLAQDASVLVHHLAHFQHVDLAVRRDDVAGNYAVGACADM